MIRPSPWMWLLLLGAVLGLPPADGRAENRFALLIASGDFPWRSPNPKLMAPVTDVRLMAGLLEWRFGFPTENTYIVGVQKDAAGSGFHYGDRRATFAGIEKGFKWLSSKARSGDYAVVFYSGHGTKIFDLSRDEPDLEDEALVTYGASPAKLDEYGLDDQLGTWLDAIRAKQVTCIFDTCFSGAVARGGRPFGSPKFVATGKGRRSTRAQAPAETNILPKGSRHVLLAACQSNEVAEEVRLPTCRERPEKIAVSAFTWALYQTLVWRQHDLTYRALMEAAAGRLRQLHRPQTPQREGGEPGWTAIAPALQTARSPMLPVLDPHSANPSLRVGWLGGIRSGMVFAGAGGRGDANAPLLNVESSDWFKSSLRLVRGRPPVPPLATPLTIPSPKTGLPLRVKVTAKGAPTPDLLLQSVDGFAFVEDDEGGHVDLDLAVEGTAEQGFHAHLVRADERHTQTFAAASLPELREQVERALSAAGIQWQLQNWDNPVHPLGLRLWSDQGILPAYRLGEEMQFFVETEKPGYLLLMAAQSSGSLDLLFPDDDRAEAWIAAGQRLAIPSERMPFVLRAIPPAGDSVVVAILSTSLLRLPRGVLTSTPESLPSRALPRSVDARKQTAFMDWLSDASRPTLAEDPLTARHITALPKEALPSAAQVDAAVLMVRTVEEEERRNTE